jgi:hypothetical protein
MRAAGYHPGTLLPFDSNAGMDARACGACSVCCTVLRVDELAKLGGVACLHQRAEGGCTIHPRRPAICRVYACLWLRGRLDDADRPDRLGAVLDLASRGGLPELVIHEAAPGAFDGSARLREIAEAYRGSMPVRMHEYGEALDPDRRFRVLLPGGEEQRVAGERVELWRDGARIAERRLPWLERLLRRGALAWRRLRLRRHRRGPRPA